MYLIRFLFIILNKYHLTLVHCCYFVLCMCIHVYVKLSLCEVCHFWWIMFIAYANVCMHKYIYFFRIHLFACILDSLGVSCLMILFF